MVRCGVCEAAIGGEGEMCVACSAAVFPFSALESTDEFINYLKGNFGPSQIPEFQNYANFNLTDENEAQYNNLLEQFDPDINYMNTIQTDNLSNKYYDGDNFNTEIKAINENNRFALLHMNIRSVPKIYFRIYNVWT